MRALRAAWPAALCAVAAVVAFLPARSGGFLDWDDRIYIVAHERFLGFAADQLRWMFFNDLPGHFQPLTWLSYAADRALWGMDPAGFHLTNLALHALNAALLYSIGAALLGGRLGAALGTLLWALHPLRAESVCWITERRDLLFVLFLLAATRGYLAHARGRPGAYSLSVLAFAAAMLSKFAAAPWPVALLALDRWLLGRRDWREKLPYFAIVALVAPLALRAQAPAFASLGQTGPGERLLQSLFAAGFYLWKTVAPWGLSPWYGPEYMQARLWIAGLGAALLAALAWLWHERRRARSSPLLAAGLFYLLMLAPAAGALKFGRQTAADRYSYAPMAGLSLLAGAGLARIATGPAAPLALGTAALALIGLAGASRAQSAHWKSSEALWTRIAALNPQSSIAQAMAAQQLLDGVRDEEGLARLRALYAQDPNFPNARLILGSAENTVGLHKLERGALSAALPHLRAAVELVPESDAHRDNLRYAEAQLKKARR